jgi:hypothetical protein
MLPKFKLLQRIWHLWKLQCCQTTQMVAKQNLRLTGSCNWTWKTADVAGTWKSTYNDLRDICNISLWKRCVQTALCDDTFTQSRSFYYQHYPSALLVMQLELYCFLQWSKPMRTPAKSMKIILKRNGIKACVWFLKGLKQWQIDCISIMFGITYIWYKQHFRSPLHTVFRWLMLILMTDFVYFWCVLCTMCTKLMHIVLTMSVCPFVLPSVCMIKLEKSLTDLDEIWMVQTCHWGLHQNHTFKLIR